jgi:hypothetical protein
VPDGVPRFAGAVAPARLAVRRIRARPLVFALLVVALGSAAALIGWSSIVVARSQEQNVRLRLGALRPADRAITFQYFTGAGQPDFRAQAVTDALGAFRDVADAPHRIQIWRSLDPNSTLATRIVTTARGDDVVLRDGRLPGPCTSAVCEAVAVNGVLRLGDEIAFTPRTRVRIVGTGVIRPGIFNLGDELGDRAVVVPTMNARLRKLVQQAPSGVIVSAALRPDGVRAARLGALRERLRVTFQRLGRGDPLIRATAPIAAIDDLTERGTIARQRLLVLAGQAAALIVALVAFVAASRREEAARLDDQLLTLGGARWQPIAVRSVEAAAAGLAGLGLALVFLEAAARRIADRDGLPASFARAALPSQTLAAIVLAVAAACVVLVAAGSRERPARKGVGSLELAALAALAVVVWQALSTGALDPAQVQSGSAGPLLVALPGLAFFVVGVVIVRLVPVLLRAAERAGRGAPFSVRLAFLTAARNGGQAGAATTFLGIALGAAIFSVGYRATLLRQGDDESRFTAGTTWRVAEGGEGDENGATPLGRYATLTREQPTPVIRLRGSLDSASAATSGLDLQLVAMPPAEIGRLTGWRDDFSPIDRAEMVRRLRPAPVHLTGFAIPRDTTAIRILAKGRTDYQRMIIGHLLLPGGGFAHVRLGAIEQDWTMLRTRVPAAWRGATVTALEFVTRFPPPGLGIPPSGKIDIASIELRGGDGQWRSAGDLTRWQVTPGANGTSGFLSRKTFAHGPVRVASRYDINGSFETLVHSPTGLPAPGRGFSIPEVVGIAGPDVAARAADGIVSVRAGSAQFPVRIVSTLRYLPTVTDRPGAFILLDYATLMAAIDSADPGLVVANEAWFSGPPPASLARRIAAPPFRAATATDVATLTAAARTDPLAAGTREMLGIGAVVAALIGLAGLLLAIRASFTTDRQILAEYEVLGVDPPGLRRSVQLRLAVLSALGITAGLLGGIATSRLIASFVAVGGTAGVPIPPIVTHVPWPAILTGLALLLAAGAIAAGLVTVRALREPLARRLRA